MPPTGAHHLCKRPVTNTLLICKFIRSRRPARDAGKDPENTCPEPVDGGYVPVSILAQGIDPRRNVFMAASPTRFPIRTKSSLTPTNWCNCYGSDGTRPSRGRGLGRRHRRPVHRRLSGSVTSPVRDSASGPRPVAEVTTRFAQLAKRQAKTPPTYSRRAMCTLVERTPDDARKRAAGGASWLPCQKSSPCSSGTFGGRAFTIDGSTSPTIHSRSAFAVGLADCATKRLRPSSVIVITDCTPPLVSTAAWLRSCSGTNWGTVSVRSPRMRQTSLATIHLRPPLANTWTGDGLMPLTLKVTLVVAWIAVEGMMPLTPRVEQDDHNDLLGSVGSRRPRATGRSEDGGGRAPGRAPPPSSLRSDTDKEVSAGPLEVWL